MAQKIQENIQGDFRSGNVAIIGRANAGKSTLINYLVGTKLSIVSRKAQTTRENILGMYQDEESQIIFVDTPGVHKAETALSHRMMGEVNGVISDVDVVLILIDGEKGFTVHDEEIFKRYSGVVPTLVVVNKMDVAKTENVMAGIAEFATKFPDVEIFAISALKGKQVKPLIEKVKQLIPISEKMYEDDFLTDKSTKFLCEERIREKILNFYHKEIPHGVFIKIREFKYKNKKNMYDIYADIICERQTHKGILIGKGGESLKRISTIARKDMEEFLEAKVFLQLYVVVKEGWRESDKVYAQIID
ncbi:MAG: GTPase Era [Bacillota bacterium]